MEATIGDHICLRGNIVGHPDKHGEIVEVVYGKSRKPVARLVPISGEKKKKKRKLGAWEGKVKVTFAPNFKMTDEELLDMR